MAIDAVDAFMAEHANSPTFTREEERELCARAKSGDREALDQLIRSVAKYAYQCVTKYMRHDPATATRLALEAAWTAAMKLDPDKGRLTTYVTWWAMQRAKRFSRCNEGGAISTPTSGTKTAYSEQADRVRSTHSLYDSRPTKKGGGTKTFAATVPDYRTPQSIEVLIQLEDLQLRRAKRRYLDYLIGMVPERWRAVIIGRRRGETLEELAGRLGVTRERIRQMEMQGRRWMRSSSKHYPFDAARFGGYEDVAQEIKEMFMGSTPFDPRHMPADSGVPGDLATILESLTLKQLDDALAKLDADFQAREAVYKGKRAQLTILRKSIQARDAVVPTMTIRGGTGSDAAVPVAVVPNGAQRGGNFFAKRPLPDGRPTACERLANHIYDNGPLPLRDVAATLKMSEGGVSGMIFQRKDVFERPDGLVKLTARAHEEMTKLRKQQPRESA